MPLRQRCPSSSVMLLGSEAPRGPTPPLHTMEIWLSSTFEALNSSGERSSY